MAEIAQTPALEALGEVLSRVVNRKERVILHDRQGRAVAALIPIEDVERLNSPTPTTRRASRASQARLQAEDVLAAARELVAEQTGSLPPWEAVKADPNWQQRWDDLLASVRSQIPPEVTPEEIEADIRAACEEVRRERLARRS